MAITHGHLGWLYLDWGWLDKAAEQLQVLLKKKPDDPTYNNDLGYIWADHDMRLDEAEKLIRKAIDEDRKERKQLIDKGEMSPDEDKDNAAYLDSLGWVLFKKKQYPEAKKYLLQAVEDPEAECFLSVDEPQAVAERADPEQSIVVPIGTGGITRIPVGRRRQLAEGILAEGWQ